VRGSDLRKKERKEKKMVTFSERLGLHLFRHKMLFARKCFQGNHFSRKMISAQNILRHLASKENQQIFLYFHAIILTYKYKYQFLFTT
jgi:hypothetical protein